MHRERGATQTVQKPVAPQRRWQGGTERHDECVYGKLNTLLRRVGTRRWREPRMALVPWGHVAPVEGTVWYWLYMFVRLACMHAWHQLRVHYWGIAAQHFAAGHAQAKYEDFGLNHFIL